mgnify:CR=1 FL=1
MDPDHASGDTRQHDRVVRVRAPLRGPIDAMPYRVFNYPSAFPAAGALLVAAGHRATARRTALDLVVDRARAPIRVHRWLGSAATARSPRWSCRCLPPAFRSCSSSGSSISSGRRSGPRRLGCATRFARARLHRPRGRRGHRRSHSRASSSHKQWQVVALRSWARRLVVHHRRALLSHGADSVDGGGGARAAVVFFVAPSGREAWLHPRALARVGTFSFEHLVLSPRSTPRCGRRRFSSRCGRSARSGRAARRVGFLALRRLATVAGLLSAARSGAGPSGTTSSGH